MYVPDVKKSRLFYYECGLFGSNEELWVMGTWFCHQRLCVHLMLVWLAYWVKWMRWMLLQQRYKYNVPCRSLPWKYWRGGNISFSPCVLNLCRIRLVVPAGIVGYILFVFSFCAPPLIHSSTKSITVDRLIWESISSLYSKDIFRVLSDLLRRPTKFCMRFLCP